MIPYPGESLGLTGYTNLAYVAEHDGPIRLFDRIAYRNTSGVSTFAAGAAAEVRSSMNPFYRDWDDPEPLVFSWVVEVVAGTGTLALTDGLGSASTSLGSHTVSGAGTLVVPTSAFDVGDLYGVNGDAVLRVECTSGSVDVDQIKLRAWPPGGARGGWSDGVLPAWDSDERVASGQAFARFVEDSNAALSAESYRQMWEGALNLLQMQTDAPRANNGVPTSRTSATFGGVVNVELIAEFDVDELTGYSAYALNTTGFVAIRPAAFPQIDPDLGLTEGVDYITPPTEVYADADALPVGGVALNEWVNVGVVYNHVADAGRGELVRVGAFPFPHEPPLDAGWITPPDLTPGWMFDWPDTGTYDPETITAVTENDVIFFASSHDWMFARPEEPPDDPADGSQNGRLEDAYDWQLGTGLYDPAGNSQPLGYVQHFPPYRVWNPNAVTAQVRPLRQYHRDDGQGGTPPRAFGGASRIRTGRAYGYD